MINQFIFSHQLINSLTNGLSSSLLKKRDRIISPCSKCKSSYLKYNNQFNFGSSAATSNIFSKTSETSRLTELEEENKMSAYWSISEMCEAFIKQKLISTTLICCLLLRLKNDQISNKTKTATGISFSLQFQNKFFFWTKFNILQPTDTR